MDYPWLIAFAIGLLSTIHCLGMCGGIVGALTFSLPQPVRDDRRRLLPHILAYNLGRIASYAAAGALVAAGAGLFGGLGGGQLHHAVQWLAAALLIAIGLHLGGWYPQLARVERLGSPLWRRIEPLGRRLLPVRSPAHAVLFGAVWGWLPCGLVYTTLLWSAATMEPLQGALTMAAFGLGTLPATASAGMLAGTLMRLAARPNVRRGAGVILILVAVATLWHGLAGEAA